MLLGVVFRTFEDFRYTDELDGNDVKAVWSFQARVGDKQIEGLDLLRFDRRRARSPTVTRDGLRPLSATMALAEAVARTGGPRAGLRPRPPSPC